MRVKLDGDVLAGLALASQPDLAIRSFAQTLNQGKAWNLSVRRCRAPARSGVVNAQAARLFDEESGSSDG